MPDTNEKNEAVAKKQPQRRPRRRYPAKNSENKAAEANGAERAGKSLPEQAKPEIVAALLNNGNAAEKRGEQKNTRAPRAPKLPEPKAPEASASETAPKQPTPKAAKAAKKEAAPVEAKQEATQAPAQKQYNRRPQQRKRNTQTQSGGQAQSAAQAAPAEPVFIENKAVVPENPKGQQKKTQQPNRRQSKKKKSILRIVPLGGLGEVGKNITVFECDGDAIISDCGLTFPDEAMPGVDLVIPDFTYIQEIKDRVKGIVITHGHEDHIGSLPYLLKTVSLPVYATKLTIGLIEGKLKEHGILDKARLNVVKAGETVKLGCFGVEFINVNHSIPDACAFAIDTPVGTLVQTGDFKIDLTPIDGVDVINLPRFGELGTKGVLALMSDSTNAERPGSTPSERTVGDSFDKLFAAAANKRIIVASFASNVHRVQQIINAAVKYKRKVAVSGRSMENVVAKALELGYLNVPSGVLVDIDSVSKYTPDKMVIVTTGSQGEPMSALSRMAMGDHRKVNVTQGDYIIISATPIPGNEKFVTRVVNELMKLGAEVIYERMYDVHVSGHACQDEIKMMLALTRPKFFLPMHGEFKHLKKNGELGQSMGILAENIFIGENGRVLETDGETMRWDGTVASGKVLVDGLGVGDVGSIVLRDRKHLAEDGLIIVVATIDRQSGQLSSGPDIVSRGFVYVRESEDMMGKTRQIAKDSITKCMEKNSREWGVIKNRIKDDVGDYIWRTTKRNPMILPIIQEI